MEKFIFLAKRKLHKIGALFCKMINTILFHSLIAGHHGPNSGPMYVDQRPNWCAAFGCSNKNDRLLEPDDTS